MKIGRRHKWYYDKGEWNASDRAQRRRMVGIMEGLVKQLKEDERTASKGTVKLEAPTNNSGNNGHGKENSKTNGQKNHEAKVNGKKVYSAKERNRGKTVAV